MDTKPELRQPEGQTAKARWTRLGVLGLVMVGSAPFLMLVAGLVWGLDLAEAWVFLAPTIVLPWVAALLVWRFGTWAKIVAIVIALAALALMFWTAFGLAVPTSFFDFAPGLLLVPGALVAVIALIGAIISGRRGHLVAARAGGERRAINIVVVLVGALAAFSAVATIVSRTSVDAADAAAAVQLKDIAYDQDSYEVPGGSQVVVRNDDPFLHTFTVDALGIDVQLGPNSSVLVDIPERAGTFVLYCRPHTIDPESPTSDDMAATLTIG